MVPAAAALTYDMTTPPKGCSWAPDGTCLLTAGDDARLRVLELPAPMVAEPPAAPENPAWRPTFDVKACECVYDYAWYPRLHSSQPSTCVFAAAARAAPPALYDAYDGRRRASYVLRDALDEPVPCLALAFSPGGATLRVAAQKRSRLAAFDVATSQVVSDAAVAQRGPLACLACIDEHVFVAGGYSGQIRVYDDRENDPGVALKDSNKMGGVTRLRVSNDAVYASHRGEDVVRGFDLRTRRVASRCTRPGHAHQRFDFDVVGETLVAGDADGAVRAFDLAAADVDKPGRVLRAEPSAANGVAVHPHRDWLAVATGSRALPDVCGEPAAASTNRVAVYAFERPK